MTKELEQLQYNDVLTDMASAMEQRGARHLLSAFKESYPSHFEEIVSQIHRLDRPPVAALLRKPDADSV